MFIAYPFGVATLRGIAGPVATARALLAYPAWAVYPGGQAQHHFAFSRGAPPPGRRHGLLPGQPLQGISRQSAVLSTPIRGVFDSPRAIRRGELSEAYRGRGRVQPRSGAGDVCLSTRGAAAKLD